MRKRDSVAIIGAGFSGTLQAINLLRHHGPRAVLIERRADIGRGVAYSTPHPGHLLNVRAGNMSAYPDEPDHFVDWLAKREHSDGNAFVPRTLYGEYLTELLETAQRNAPDRLEIIAGEARGIDLGEGVDIHLTDGRTIRAEAAVLALGNLPPVTPDNLDTGQLSSRYIPDPWSHERIEEIGRHEHVLILGTGLTMIDVVLLLDARGFEGQITAMSRRGLSPRPQSSDSIHRAGLSERPAGELSRLLRSVRLRSGEIGWRAAIDELRPFTQNMWLAASTAQKCRFLRHLRPWWDVHRHRLAPQVAERISELRGQGRLQVVAGRPVSYAVNVGGVEVIWRPRGEDDRRRLEVTRIVNCTGPHSDLMQTQEALLNDLVDRGIAAPDALGLGLRVDGLGRLIDAGGESTRLFALGPMTRGVFWEITAVPDIRVQTWNLARYLSNAHWVGGEGL